MKRTAIDKLALWKANKDRKPLIIRGARQVGKTWLMKEFGSLAYQQTIYINFENNRQMQALFSGDYDIARLVMGMELFTGKKIEPKTTLILFDEVQEVPQALTALKYFYENAPEYQIICAGSLLGIALHEGTSFPVGKVDFLDLYPMSFQEFLLAMGDADFSTLLRNLDFPMITTFKDHYIERLKQYYYVGGMPEAVKSFVDQKDFSLAREIQQRILDAYEQDFSKHAPYETVPRIRMLWNSIPMQLAKDNRKFIYKLVKEGARAREYETAMLWLTDCGLVHPVYRVNKPGVPLKSYADLKAFKLYFVDIGLLSCMVRLQPKTLLDGSAFFEEFKGALTEQYVLQQLMTVEPLQVFYWANDSGNAEVDFLLDDGQQVYPVEVKAETNLKARSLRVYRDQYQAKLSLRVSMADYSRQEWLINLPLYAVEYVSEILLFGSENEKDHNL